MAATRTTASAILKDLWDQGALIQMAEKEDPLVPLIPKKTDFTGETYKCPVGYGTNQSVGAVFAAAQGVGGANRWDRWEITPQEYYGFAEIARTLLATAKPGEGALADGLKTETEGTAATLATELAFQIYRDGTGMRDRASLINLTTITLSHPRMSTFFEEGMYIFTDPDDGTGAATNTGRGQISAINREAGTLTAASNWATLITTAATNDYIFRSGAVSAGNDFAAGLKGLGAYIPATAPAGALYGVARAADPERLGGVRVSCVGLTLEESALKMANALAGKSNAKPDICIIHQDRWADLNLEMIAKGYRDFRSSKAETGFESIVVRGPRGPIDIYGSVYCQYDVMWMLQRDQMLLVSAGDMPGIHSDEDGLYIKRRDTSANYEVRFGWFGEFLYKAPGRGARGALA